MARLVGEIHVEHRGLDECVASMRSIAEAASNAHLDILEIGQVPDGLTAMGMTIARFSVDIAGEMATFAVRPTASIVLFVSAVMVCLPTRAKLTWVDGWPRITCPPRDDRDEDDDPTPLVPNELVPA